MSQPREPTPQDPQRGAELRATVLPTIVLVTMLVALIGTWWEVNRRWEEAVQKQVETAAQQASLRLEDYINARLLALDGLVQAYARGLISSDDQFSTRALIIQERFGGFQAINSVAPDGVIHLVTPNEPNRGAFGKNVLDHPVAGRAFERAREERTPHVTRALELFQGGRGFASYFPVLRGDQRVAYVNGVFRSEDLVRDSLRTGILDRYDVFLRDDFGDLYGEPLDSDSERPHAQATLSVLDREWHMDLSPNESLWQSMRSNRPDGVFLFAGFLVLIVSWLLRVALLRQVEQARLERQQQELQRHLQHSNKMEAIGRLAGGISHDFNNILTAIIGNAQLLRLSLADDIDEARQYRLLDDLESAAEQAAGLTQQLLAFSRQGLTTPEILDLTDAIEELSPMFRRLLRESIHLHMELAHPPDARILINRSQFGQLLLNLVVNASDAMSDGGELSIETHPERRNGDVDGVNLSVTDTGHGMDAATRERIFEPFFTTKQHSHGTGLGLATVYGIVQQAGGEIEVTSEPERGATFDIWLPCTTDEATPHATLTSGLLSSPALEPIHILLAEDNEAVRRPLAEAIRMHGHTVTEARDGREALELIEHDDAHFDALITDGVMPNLGGVELIDLLRSRRTPLRMVLCTGYTEAVPDDIDVPCILKPCTAVQLLEIVRDLKADDADDSDFREALS